MGGKMLSNGVIITVYIFINIITLAKTLFLPKSGINEDLPNLLLGSLSQSEIDGIEIGMRIRVYKGQSFLKPQDIPITDPKAVYEHIDPQKPLVIYIHGFRENPSNESVETVVGAYLERGEDNIIVLNWSDLASDNYIAVIKRIKEIGRVLAEFFHSIVELGFDFEHVHIVGHSLGAQIGGFFGKYSNFSIPRITGLDPAYPGFYYPGAEHIDAGSARFVDVIHTDGGFYGVLESTGTADFFANGGTRAQPGCSYIGIPLTPSDLCNHWRSWRYYAESVKNIHAFPAKHCSSYQEFILGRCHKNPVIYFGYAAPSDARGSYFFTTNSEHPYGRSVDSSHEN